MDILIIEDESKVLAFLKGALEAEGHRIHACPGYAQALEFFEAGTEAPELVILDRMLGREEGADLIRPIRRAAPGAKILILSAISTVDEKARLLDLGADDYLSKPFSVVELSARVRALKRRSSGASDEMRLRFGDLNLDFSSRSTWAANRKVDLSNKEFQLLATFMKIPGKVHSKYQLLNQIWDVQSEIESNVVEVTIRNLRNKLGASGSTVLIQSRRNVGYWIEN